MFFSRWLLVLTTLVSIGIIAISDLVTSHLQFQVETVNVDDYLCKMSSDRDRSRGLELICDGNFKVVIKSERKMAKYLRYQTSVLQPQWYCTNYITTGLLYGKMTHRNCKIVIDDVDDAM